METANRFKLPEAMALLARTPTALTALLSGLPEPWLSTNKGPNTWSAIDIVGHLVSLERTQWIQRVEFVLQNGDERPFPPVDRFPHLKNDQPKSLDQLLKEFAQSRAHNLRTLQALNLQPSDLNRPGQHPALGAVTLSQMLATWAVHDLNHLHQLSRVLANQYREAVGPWQAYMGVLQCNGHSTP